MPRYLKPPFPLRVMNRLMIAFNVVPTLRTQGRRTGRWRAAPVNVLEVNGDRYLVSTRGNSHWVRNLQANPRAELKVKNRTERISAVPTSDGERQKLVDAYKASFGKQVEGYFKSLPDLADHPVFRIETA